MCGITGWINWNRDLSTEGQVLTTLTDTLAARGPDASGLWLSVNAAIGHRRLTVVDPIGGGQPMIRQRGEQQFILSYNGELYNTPELRRELETLGHTFQGHSDTEVLLVSYIQWGPACVARFNGIFAFAVWDDHNQRLFMARDRVGVKPLFYINKGDEFIFASELKTLLAHPSVEPLVDAEGLAEIFVMGPARTPGHGVFKHIYELRPGYSLIFDQAGMRQYQYWALSSHEHTDNFETTVSTVRTLLLDSIQRQLVSDVPICTLLSGGLDSSAITAVAANTLKTQGKAPLRTFSIDFVGNDVHFKPDAFQPNADAPWIKRVSEEFNTLHHYITFDSPDLVEALKAAMLARDLPGMADIDASLLLFSKEIKRLATVGLSGECADEIFGGYPWFHREDARQATTFPWSLRVGERVKLLSPDLVEQIRPEQYIQYRYQEALNEIPRLPGESPEAARTREIFYLSITRFMPTLLDRKDRMTMAAGLEVRVPFCDHRLLEYVWNVPWEMKFCEGQAKGLLRRALEGILPNDVLARRKSPYPKTHNPSYLQAICRMFLEVLEEGTSPLLNLIDTKKFRAMAQTAIVNPGQPWFGQLMGDAQFLAFMLQIHWWLTEYKVQLK